MLDPVIPLLAALCGALLFGWTAVHKWRALREFTATLAEYRVLPAFAVPVAAPLLALLETAVAVALAWPEARSWGAATGAVLLLLYAGGMAINLARDRRTLDCGCGLVHRPIGWALVARNLLLAAAFAVPLMPAATRVMTFGDYATVFAALAVFALLYASAEMLLARPPMRPFPAAETP